MISSGDRMLARGQRLLRFLSIRVYATVPEVFARLLVDGTVQQAKALRRIPGDRLGGTYPLFDILAGCSRSGCSGNLVLLVFLFHGSISFSQISRS